MIYVMIAWLKVIYVKTYISNRRNYLMCIAVPLTYKNTCDVVNLISKHVMVSLDNAFLFVSISH